jgi:hypothetical protein
VRTSGVHLLWGSGAGLVLAVALAATLVLPGLHHLSGEYDREDGSGRLEFRGSRVYVTTVLGMTFVTTYEVDGDRVIIKGGGGAQVYTRRGDTLDAGMGMKYVKHEAHSRAARGRDARGADQE